MNLYVKQNFFSFRDRFYVYDDAGNEKYYVEGEIFSLGKKLRLFDLQGNVLAFIDQKIFSFQPKFRITTSENRSFEIIKNFTFWNHKYTVEPFGWTVCGDFFAHDYVVTYGDSSHVERLICVYKEWFTFGDAYKIEIEDGIDEISALSVVLVIDACIDQQENCNV